MKTDTFRVYDENNETVKETYRKILTNQTLDYVRDVRRRSAGVRMSMWDAIHLLNSIVDESDPDIDLPQTFHSYQTAERMRRAYFSDEDGNRLRSDLSIREIFGENAWQRLPTHIRTSFYPTYIQELYSHFGFQDWSWLRLVGFIHDAGKVQVLSSNLAFSRLVSCVFYSN